MNNKNKKEGRTTASSASVLFSCFIFIALALVLIMPSVSAKVTGDLPIVAFKIGAYSDPQTATDPCDNTTTDGGTTLYAWVAAASGDATYNDNDDYLLDFTNNDPTTYVYFCDGGLLAWISINHDEGSGNHIVDVGQVDGSGLHADLESDYVHVCDGATQLNTENEQVSGGTYDQYFTMDETDGGSYSNLVVWLDGDTTANCTHDTTKSTGRDIVRSASSPDNYAIALVFSPDTKASDAIHNDINAAGFLKVNGTSNFGMTGQLSGTPYNLYYDDPGAGTLTMYVNTGIDTSFEEVVSGIANGFVTQKLDRKIWGNVPSDIDEVREVIGTITYTVAPSGGAYAIYIPSNAGAQTLEFRRGGVTVFNVTVNADAADVTYNIGKISGTVHSNLTGGTFQAYKNNNCTTPANGSSPSTISGVTYEHYFVDDAPTNYYSKVVDLATHDTCGNLVSLVNQEITLDLTAEVAGTVPTSISAGGTVVVDKNQNNAYDGSDAYTQTFVGQTYRVYSTTGAVDVDFYTDNTVPPVMLALTRAKTLASTLTLDVAAVNWATVNVHADLKAGGICSGGAAACQLEVWDDAQAGMLSSQNRDFGVNSIQHYELPAGGLVDYLIYDAGGADYEYYVNNFTETAGDTQLFEPNTQVNFTVPGMITDVELLGGSIFNYNDNTSAAVPPPSYAIYLDRTECIGGQLYTNNLYDTGMLELSRTRTYTQGTDDNFYANSVGGEAPAGLENAGDGADDIKIYNDSACTVLISSELEQPSDNQYPWGDDYLQYYESNGSGVTKYYMVPVMDNGNVFDDSCVYFMSTGDGIQDSFHLHEVNGTVHTDIIGVGIDSDQSGAGWGTSDNSHDEVYSTDITVAGEYHVFNINTSSADIRYYTAGPVLAFLHNAGAGTDMSLGGGTTTIDVGKLSGSVPGGGAPELHGGTVYAALSMYPHPSCFAQTDDESIVSIVDGGAVDTYALYLDTSKAYYVRYCDVTPDVEYHTFVTKAGTTTGETLDLAAVGGSMDTNFSTGAGARIEVYNDFGMSLVGTTQRSVNDGAGICGGVPCTEAGTNYIVYFEVSGTQVAATLNDTTFDADAVIDIALKINDNTPDTSWEIGMEMVDDTTAFAAGDSKTADFVNDLGGAIPDDVDRMGIFDTLNGDVWNIGIVTGTPGVYQIYARAHPANVEYALHDSIAPRTVLTKVIGALPDDTLFDAAKLNGTIGSTFRTAGVNGTIDVFDDWNNGIPAIQYNSVSFTTDGGGANPDLYEVYFEIPSGGLPGTEDLMVTDYQGYESWIMDFTAGVWPGGPGAIIAGDKKTWNLDPTLSGATPTAISWIEVFGTGAPGTQYAVGIPVGNFYNMFVPQINDAGNIMLRAYTGAIGGGTLELSRITDAGGGVWGAGYTETFDVGEVTGLAHLNMQGPGGDVQVYDTSTCGTLLSSETETPGPIYTQYFESSGATAPFHIWIMDNSGALMTCGNKGFNFTGTQNRTGYNMDRMVNGNTPSTNFDVVTWGGSPADTDIVKISADVDGDMVDDFTTSPVITGPAVPDFYMMFVDSTEPGLSNTTLNFYGFNPSFPPAAGLELDRTINLSTDNTMDIAKVAGLADQGLWGGVLKVCSGIPTLANWGNCTTYYDGLTTIDWPTGPFGWTGNETDFDLFFEQPFPGANYYVELFSAGGVYPLGAPLGPSFTYHIVTTGLPGDYIYQDFDGVVYGFTNESYNMSIPIPNVEINMYDTGGMLWPTSLIRAYTDAMGYYEIYSSGSVGHPAFPGEPGPPMYWPYDMEFVKTGYMTRDWTTDGASFWMNDGSWALQNFGIEGSFYGPGPDIIEDMPGNKTIFLMTGIIVTVQDQGGNPINDATVSIYDCGGSNLPSACTTIGNCTNPMGNCSKNAADNPAMWPGQYFFTGITPGNFVQIRVSKPPFDTQFDPAKNASVNWNVAGGGNISQLMKTLSMIDSSPECDLEYYIYDQATGQQKEVGRDGDSVLFQLDCGESGLNTTINATSVDNVTIYPTAMTDNADGTYTFWTMISGGANGPQPVTFWASDGLNSDSGLVIPHLDNTIPAVTMSGPSVLQNTLSVLIYATTNESAECRYSTVPGTAFNAMMNVMAGQLTIHEAMVMATNNVTNNYYVRCRDTVGNAMTSDANISFSVDAKAPTVINSTPVSGLYNAGTLPPIQVMTDMNATCRWDNKDASYANMIATAFLTNASAFATLPGATASEGANRFYIRCQSLGGNAVEMSSSALIAFDYDNVTPSFAVEYYTDSQLTIPLTTDIKTGPLYLKITASEQLNVEPTISINQQGTTDIINAATTWVSGSVYNYTYTVHTANPPTYVDGVATVTLSGTDFAGNTATNVSPGTGATFTIDTTPPTFTETTAASFTTRSVLITGTTGEAATCRFHTSDVAYGSMAYDLGNIDVTTFAANYFAAEGSNTIYVRCQDTAGNAAGTSTTVTFTVDSIAPAVTVVGPSGWVNSTAQTLNISTGNASDSCAYALLDVPYASMAAMTNNGDGTFSQAVTAVEGTNIYYVRCQDASGNTMDSSSIILFKVDTTSPVVSIETPAPGAITNSQAVKFTVTDGGIGVDLSTINVALTGGTSVFVPGTHCIPAADAETIVCSYTDTGINGSTTALTVSGADVIGNAITPTAVPFTYDTTPPTFTETTAASFTTRSVLITGTTGEAATCRFHTSDVAYGSMAYDLGNIDVTTFAANYFAAEGSNTIYVRCQDTAGNAAGTSTTVTFTVDSIAPTITFNANSYGPFRTDPGNVIDVDFADALSNLDSAYYKIGANGTWTAIFTNSGAMTNNTNWGVAWGSLSEGENTIYVKVNDSVGNKRMAIETITFIVDITAPTVMIVSPINGIMTGANTTLSVLTDENANCNYSLDGAAYAAMATTGTTMHFQDLTSLNGTSHTVNVNCSDLLGNGPVIKSVTWTVDASGPQVLLVFLDPENTNEMVDLYATVWSPNSVLAGAEYFFDTPGADGTGTALVAEDGVWDETYETVNITINVSALGDGQHVMIIHARNANGWGSYYIGANSFVTLDTVNPVIHIISPENGSVAADTTPLIEFWLTDGDDGSGIDINSVTVNVTGFNASTDCIMTGWGGPPSYYCSFTPAPALTDNATHIIGINTSDMVGNNASESVSFFVDTLDFVDLTSLSADKTTAAATGTDWWEYTLTITLGGHAGDRVRIKMANWTMEGTVNEIPVDGWATMRYTNASSAARTYDIKEGYDLLQTVDEFLDEDGVAPGIQATIKIRQLIPANTVAGSYFTTYGMKSYWI